MKNSNVIPVVLGLIVALAASSSVDAQGSGQTPPCCLITAIDAGSRLLTARDQTTGSTWQFTTPPALLPRLKIGQKVRVDPAMRVVSVEGAPNCCRLAQSSPPPTLGRPPELEVQTPIRPEAPSRSSLLKPAEPQSPTARQHQTQTPSSEWKYVNVRRYMTFLEASIDRSTQWAVFEPNGERLWANIRETVSSLLYSEWRVGALKGGSPKEAFFVRCDRSTMTQNDLDKGRLVCLIGVAVIKPAEFVTFRISQKTADTRN
jgi:hypothetical protein